MTSTDSELIIETELPLCWRPLTENRLNKDFHLLNQQAFVINEVMEAGPSHLGDTGKEKLSDLARLEHKLDLVIQLLGKLLGQSQTGQSLTPVRLSAHKICWQSEQHIEGQGYLELLLSRDSELPVYISGTSIREGQWFCLTTEGMSETEREAWDKWLFRYHRRQVAARRHSG